MRVAKLSKSRRTRVSNSVTIPAPVGGLNSNDSPFNLKPNEAPSNLQNYFPRLGYLEARTGSSSYATGTTGNIKTIATYSGLSGSESVFVGTSSGIYNATSSGAVGAAVIARTEGYHQWTMFGDGTNNWLCMFNGVDKPAFYNGTTWTAVDGVSVPAITGVTTTGLIGACSYQGRLFLIEKDRLKFWYLPAGAVGGAATAFDLSAQCSRGGYLMAALPFTYDGGSGMDDVIVFVTSMGEAICYKGTDPGTAANWIKLGTYFIGKPVGRKCMQKLGGDVLVITENGIAKMSAAMNGVVDDRVFFITDKIRDEYNTYYRSYGGVVGWEITIFHREQALILNVPTLADTTSFQYVMNINTGAWTIFSGWSANAFGVANNSLYYARTTNTFAAWNGTYADEGGTDIGYTFRTYNIKPSGRSKSHLKAFSVNLEYGASGMTETIWPWVNNVYYTPYTKANTTTSGFKNDICTAFAPLGEYYSIYHSVDTNQQSSATVKIYSITMIFESGGLI